MAEELEKVKKSLKMTTQAELSLQMQIYQDECTRLRSLLEQELAQSQQNVAAMAQNHINILSITSEEDRRRLTSQFQAMERKLAEATQANERLTRELEDQKKKALLLAPAKRNT